MSSMGLNRAWKKGDYLVQCDRSGMTIPRSMCRYEWNGLLVRKDWWEIRQPQDLIHLTADRQAVPDNRSIVPDVFLQESNPVLPSDL